MCRSMLIFNILKHGSSTLNFNSSDNIARIIKCDISKSKLALSTCNGVYFSSTALIVFTLYEIKQVKIFLGHPVYIEKNSKTKQKTTITPPKKKPNKQKEQKTVD